MLRSGLQTHCQPFTMPLVHRACCGGNFLRFAARVSAQVRCSSAGDMDFSGAGKVSQICPGM
jgi:hypothetical protein